LNKLRLCHNYLFTQNTQYKKSMRLNNLISVVAILSLLFFLQECDRLENNGFHEPETTHGVIRDFSNIDGCGLVIELDDGTIIVPYLLDKSLMFADGQEVEFTYKELPDMDYECTAGLIAEITGLEMAGCSPIILLQRVDNTPAYSSLVADPFSILNVKIENDCLKITLSYSGGCEIHEFIMAYNELPHFGIYSGTLTLSHNAHGDMCEALITKTISYDLSPLQKDESNMVRLKLVKSGDQDYQLIIDYYY
jgi:hypothetical protein